MAGERGHDVTLLEAMPWAGGQVRLAARNPRRRDLLGIVEWREQNWLGSVSKCASTSSPKPPTSQRSSPTS